MAERNDDEHKEPPSKRRKKLTLVPAGQPHQMSGAFNSLFCWCQLIFSSLVASVTPETSEKLDCYGSSIYLLKRFEETAIKRFEETASKLIKETATELIEKNAAKQNIMDERIEAIKGEMTRQSDSLDKMGEGFAAIQKFFGKADETPQQFNLMQSEKRLEASAPTQSPPPVLLQTVSRRPGFPNLPEFSCSTSGQQTWCTPESVSFRSCWNCQFKYIVSVTV